MNSPQTILAIDTSTTHLSLALQHAGRVHSLYLDATNRHAQLILPHIRQLFQAVDIHASDLNAIAYAQGPGAFTGLRIGIGVAQGLATPFHTPLIGIPCLDAIAYQIPDSTCVLAATDARMGEVFYAWFDTKNHRRLSDYSVGKAAEIRAPDGVDWGEISAVGNAFALDPVPPFSSGSLKMPNAQMYLALAQTGRYPTTDAAHAELLYVRNKIALTAAEQMARKQQKSEHSS